MPVAVVPQMGFKSVENAAHRYGGRLFSVIGVSYKTNNADNYHAEPEQALVSNHDITTFRGSEQPNRPR